MRHFIRWMGSVVLIMTIQLPPTGLGQSLLEANGGTWTFGTPPTQPATLIWFNTPWVYGAPIRLTLSGLPGWNNGAPHSWPVMRSNFFGDYDVLRDVKAIAGPYVLTAVLPDQRRGTKEFSINLSGALTRPTFRVRIEARRYIVDYDSVANARQCTVLVERLGTDQSDNASTSPCHSKSIMGISVLPAGKYRVTVSAYTFSTTGNTDLPKPGQTVHGSESVQEFEIP